MFLIFLEISFGNDYEDEQDIDMVDLPIGEDYYYDDYMYEVEDAKPLPLPPMPLMTNPIPKPRLKSQSIKLNKAELMELYRDLSDVLDEMPQNLPIKQSPQIMTQMPIPPPIELEEEDLIKFKNIHTKGDLLALYADLSDVLDEMQNINFPIVPNNSPTPWHLTSPTPTTSWMGTPVTTPAPLIRNPSITTARPWKRSPHPRHIIPSPSPQSYNSITSQVPWVVSTTPG